MRKSRKIYETLIKCRVKSELKNKLKEKLALEGITLSDYLRDLITHDLTS